MVMLRKVEMPIGNRRFLTIEQKTFYILREGVEHDVIKVLENGRGFWTSIFFGEEDEWPLRCFKNFFW